MTDRRQVRVPDQFFDRLDLLLPQERSADGLPSGADFLLHEMPKIIDALAEDHLGVTLPVADVDDVRMLSSRVFGFVMRPALTRRSSTTRSHGDREYEGPRRARSVAAASPRRELPGRHRRVRTS